MTDILRREIAESGLPLLQLAQKTGIARASLIRFTRGQTSLRLDIADRLADYFGLRLTRECRDLHGGQQSERKENR